MLEYIKSGALGCYYLKEGAQVPFPVHNNMKEYLKSRGHANKDNIEDIPTPFKIGRGHFKGTLYNLPPD